MESILDIFMLLNKNNDGYIDYEETKPLRDVILSMPGEEDRGKIQKDDDFLEIFKSF